ncbi:MAG: AmmeMemoRadiSam system protein B, partial [Candidatus Omnitrophota bacterium]
MRKIWIAIFILCAASAVYAADVKEADLAGLWYPADTEELSGMLTSYIDQANPPEVGGDITALIVPHAGYRFSGPVAGYGFKAVAGGKYNTVVIVGFSHRKPYDGISVYGRGVFKTPLGQAGIDEELAGRIIAYHRDISFYPDLFKDENSVEMIIPFVQLALKDAKIVPVAFGEQSWERCRIFADALAAAIGGRKDVLVIASTDMSHYYPYSVANRIDGFTIKRLEKLEPEELYKEIKLGTCEMCGAAPVVSVMMAMKKMGAEGIKILKYQNSGDTTGNRSEVVGYASAAFYKKGARQMAVEKQKKRLLEIARHAMEAYIKTGKTLEFKEDDPELLKAKGAFVTLHKNGDLRGCIGNIIGHGPLYKTVRDMAIASSTQDPRFSRVSASELDDIKIEISVLSQPVQV